MASWPAVEELRRVLNVRDEDVANDDALATILSRSLAAAITRVKRDVGTWDDDIDEPNDNLSQAALRMAELINERPDAAPGTRAWRALGSDPTYQTLLIGERRSFGIG